MKEFIWEYRNVIVYFLGLVIYIVLEYDRNKIKDFMLQAKHQAKDKILETGEQQKHFVLTKARIFVPGFAFLPAQAQEYIVEVIYKKAMDKLDDGKLNGSY